MPSKQSVQTSKIEDALRAVTNASLVQSKDEGERGGVQRKPFLLTTQRSWAGGAGYGVPKDSTYILFYINPQSATWTFKRRVSIQQLRHYSVVHYQNRRSEMGWTLYEEPTLTLEFTTGSLVRVSRKPGARRGQPVEFDYKMPTGLDNYYRLLQMMDENPMLSNGQPNYVHLVYNSMVFPDMTIRAHFTEEGPSITESSDDPNKVSYSISLQVTRTNPKFHRYADTINAYQGSLTMSQLLSAQELVQVGGPTPPLSATEIARASKVQLDTAQSVGSEIAAAWKPASTPTTVP